MRNLEAALKAAGDPTRTRILKLLERQDLCVCQVQAVLRLAPSTVSKHLAEAMGGRLSVNSEVGVGSVFTLHLLTAGSEQQAKLTAMSSTKGEGDENE